MNAAFPVFNGYAPAEGPRCLPYTFSFTSGAPIFGDLFKEQTEGILQFVQTLWIDNSDNPNPFEIRFTITGQRIFCPANFQGQWPVFASSQVQFVAETTGTIDVPVIFGNMPMPISMYGANAPSVTIAPIGGSYTDRSGAIAVGGTSQQAAAADAGRQKLIIQNPDFETESLFINFGAAAVISSGGAADSIELLPGGAYVEDGIVIGTQSINVNATTTGHRYVIKEIV